MLLKSRGPIKVYPGSLITKLSKLQGPKRKWPLTSNGAVSNGTTRLLPLIKPVKRTPLQSLLLQ